MNRFRLLRKFGRRTDARMFVGLLGAAFVLLPVSYVLSGLLRPANDNWAVVRQYLLTDYVVGSGKLVACTGFLAASIGLLLAWLVAGYTFPLRNFFRWALLLPLAVPPYIAAYTYAAMTSYTGVVQATLRNRFDLRLAPGSIEIASDRGAVFILTICLFPYVYMIVRMFLERQSASYIENARLLGRRGLPLFLRVVLPLSRPALIGGAMLVAFETLGDYGVASYFGVQTMSTAIFQTWFGMYDVESAIRLAAWLMVAIVGLFVFERTLRRSRKYHASAREHRTLSPRRLRGWQAFAAFSFCLVVWLAAFLVPVLQLIVWSVWTHARSRWAELFGLIADNVAAAAAASAVIVLIALAAAGAVRAIASPAVSAASKTMNAGYAIPGAIVAIGVLAVFLELDRLLSPLYVRLGREEGALVASLSLAMLLFGWVVRFMAVGYNAIETGYEKMPRTLTEAPRTLGVGKLAAFLRVELPLLKGATGTAFVLAFVEIMKELPLTLLLRPFNFDTLATKAYIYASDERIYEAALPSLLLIAVGLVPTLLVARREGGNRR